ncbi:NTP pyrophosphatase, house-cleaning of non-canonical NTPs [Collimonas sp. OK307]|uniref:nucleotide pyrophosphohydrolase n=1 Tax=Collimonas sp. OK307 TaxID=1801620 RepID=UPI0008E04B98|nr:nucleotide pyrophosphohydrolase [Collimonas sp. OK307]SFH80173.1 NTP pyrophosphatase, house-cleaning of non-canonical NTPs [Collimonas sp. OK307]
MADQSEKGDFSRLREEIRQFVAERDWDQFHTPKNLSSALCVEAAELLEHFQWLPTGSGDELNPAKLQQVRHEMADVLVYLIRLADKLDVDLSVAVSEKMILNRLKYPADKVRGDARKYSEYEDE